MDQTVKNSQRDHSAAPSIQAELGLGKKARAPSGRRLLFGLLILGLAGGSYWGWQRYSTGVTTQQVNFQTVPVQTGDMTVEVTATGTLAPLTQVDISSELSGVVREVNVSENQTVKKGDVLAVLDTTRLAAEIERAEASLKAANARVEDARTTVKETSRTFERSNQLSRRGLATEQQLDTATAARDRAQSALAVAEANAAIASADLKLQQTSLEKSSIYAPIDGIVLTRSVDTGQTVASSLQAPVLFVIAADLRKMELKAAVDEADIGGVKAGQKATFTVDAFPGRTFTAGIRDVAFAAVTTDGVVTYDARLDVENEELLLRPGMTATVAIVTREAKDILTVPTSAFRFRPPAVQQDTGWSLDSLFRPPMRRSGNRDQRPQRTDGSRALYVLKDGAAEMVFVKPGATDGEQTEIVSGLVAGDQVIVGTGAQQRGQGASRRSGSGT